MTFRQFAFNNIRRNSRQYLSYFLSATFSVAVFFIYAVLVFHPEVQEATFRRDVQQGILAAEIIIFVFSFLFVLYSTGSFVKSRKQEFGLLTTLGISRGQLNRMIFIENTIIGIVSILSGIIVGGLLSKIFIMTFSEILKLDQALSFYLAPEAILLTAGAYFIMFELNSFLSLWTIRMNSVMELFRGSKAPKKAPKFSWNLSILSLLLIGAGYYLAITANLLTIVSRILPILACIVPGTYLLFSQFSIAFTKALKSRKSLFFKKTNMLTISDLMYKLKDNSRVLFLVTILSAVAFTSSGVLYGAFQGIKEETEKYEPLSIMMATTDNMELYDNYHNKIIDELKKLEIPYQSLEKQLLKAEAVNGEGKSREILVVNESTYNQYAELTGREGISSIQSNEAVLLNPNASISSPYRDSLSLQINGVTEEFETTTRTETAMPAYIYLVPHVAVVSDKQLNQFTQVAEPGQYISYLGISIDRWTEYVDEAIAVQESLSYTNTHPFKENIAISFQAENYTMLKRMFSLTLYFGVFISVLFFLAAGSILYFRMYQDIDNDLHYYRALYKIGLTKKEMRGIATKQILFLFMAPFFIAVAHAGFAFAALQNMLAASVLWPSTIILGAFLIIHTINFLFIRQIYIKKIATVM
ncbi:ABC transporter permease [Halobacillus shinanisalinarum]|uniref:ABC transporter permease n=1 Tax=Halobacillus shinanisalinarum TaxID=2932258 RepID=A0ABY4GX85_9BACI|nr:ABC transporter permease [Halobacillus shinanisalinarum]UOQ92626.1 ABC transporter permease [Halobacillus shinanisalinarum]